ncbi:MAG TPA: hypothetical protein EYQ42_07010 [Thiotrichaceae bacterium]|jgi:hypothetical protein|nr:hypothetical protein [Thiotrichaceae bacterium]HIM06955.1 hypothetical protein [Gammaproteobacteria bacterium]
MKSLIIALVLVLTSSSTFAIDSKGNYAVWGLGKKSCFGYTQAIAGGDIENFKHYIKGFLTAYNMFTEKTYSIARKMNINEIAESLEDYCAENPMSGFETALLNFTFDRYDSRLKRSGNSVGR